MLLQYEPELFPGLVYRMEAPKVVVLVFVSGKIVVTGAKVKCPVLWSPFPLHAPAPPPLCRPARTCTTPFSRFTPFC